MIWEMSSMKVFAIRQLAGQLNVLTKFRGFPTRMVYLYFLSCLRYTILVGNPRNKTTTQIHMLLTWIKKLLLALIHCDGYTAHQRILIGLFQFLITVNFSTTDMKTPQNQNKKNLTPKQTRTPKTMSA